MALISCPECKRQVSDKALSCPGCGYPLRQEPGSAEVTVPPPPDRPGRKPEEVLVTGPNGIPLQQELVGQFCSFIEWILDVKLTDDDQGFVRDLMIKEWSQNDVLVNLFALTGIAVGGDFEDASKETREYWREVFLFRLEDVAPGFEPTSGLIRQICDRARVQVRRKGLPLTREICDAELNQRCFKAGVLSGTHLELKSLSDEYREGYWEMIGRECPDAVAYKYLENTCLVKGWPHLSEADRSSVEQKWREEAKSDAVLEGLVRAAQKKKDDPLGLKEMIETLKARSETMREHMAEMKSEIERAEAERDNASRSSLQEAQQANASLSDILVGKRWQARSHSLAGQGLVVAFMSNGEFSGQLTEASYTTPAQPVRGKWQVIEPQLFLDYVYNAQVDSGFTMQVIPTSAQIQIHITQASGSKLLGVDQFARAWEWERIG